MILYIVNLLLCLIFEEVYKVTNPTNPINAKIKYKKIKIITPPSETSFLNTTINRKNKSESTREAKTLNSIIPNPSLNLSKTFDTSFLNSSSISIIFISFSAII